MARITEPTTEQEYGWREWVASRPANVKAVAERFDPWSLYRMKDTGQRVTIASFGEEDSGTVTLTVNVSADFNFTLFERQVFGVNPDALEPCDLPSPDEPRGTMLSGEQVEENIDALRVFGRPDLWEMGTDGKARRKSTTSGP